MPKVSEMLDSLWNRILTALGEKLSPSTIDSWFRPCHLAAVDGDHLRLVAPNSYTRDWIIQHHAPALATAARTVIGGNPQVTVDVDSDSARTAPPSPTADGDGISLDTALSTRYTFDSFVVGNSNQFAQAACQAVAELPSKAYNPLFIYGGVGLGKTHLLHAIGHQIARLYPTLRL